MIKNYLTVTLRALRRNKGYAFINLAGLALGMAACLVMLLYVQDERSYDRFHEQADREISWGIFLLAGRTALGIAVLMVSYQSIRAALADPVKALRYE